MRYENLSEVLEGADNPVDLFRNTDLERTVYSPGKSNVFPDEYSNWIDEQRAIQESCVIVDQSHHMMVLYVEGPEAVDLYSDLSVNSFENIRNGSPPQAKHLVQCNPDGYSIRDVVLFHVGENEFITIGSPVGNNWLRYNLKTDDYDATLQEPVYSPIRDDGVTPPDFRFEVQGPHALKVMDEVTDEPLPEISFFQMDEISINGRSMFALGHGMAEAPGLEIFGPYEYHDEIWDVILKVGRDYGIRQLGSKAYKTGKVGSGWIKLPVPAIYESDEMQGYREWLDAESIEATMSIGGSYESDDITDYYMTPFELGYGRHIKFDHDFVGREALEEMAEQPQREKVTFVWNDQDVIDVYASLFREGDTNKFIDLPDTANRWSKTHYDKVLKDSEIVGLSKYPGYLVYEQSMLSLGTIDPEYSEPGTEVTFVWGEEDSVKSKVEHHVEREIRATVAPSPYNERGRRDM